MKKAIPLILTWNLVSYRLKSLVKFASYIASAQSGRSSGMSVTSTLIAFLSNETS